MLITLKHKKVVEKLVKKVIMVKNTHLLNEHMSYVHIGIASMRQFQCVPTTYLTENKPIVKSRIMSISFASLKYLNLPQY